MSIAVFACRFARRVSYNSFNCAQVINVTFPAFNGSFFDLGVDQRIQLGQTAQIEVKTDAAIKTITWTPSNVSVNDEKKYYTVPSTTTLYSASALYGKGCLFTDQITIFVDTVERKLEVPNIFTPNGDGINDDFYVKHNSIKTFQIWIFDRWGVKVYIRPMLIFDGLERTVNPTIWKWTAIMATPLPIARTPNR